jgi:metallophosphoesterase (TIGR00282 family)
VKILFIGDVVGEPGRRAIQTLVPNMRRDLGLDWVVANGENIAGGSGITIKTGSSLLDSGVDVITTGDHVWDQKESMGWIVQEPRLLRPINYPAEAPGRGSILLEKDGFNRLAVINVQGRVFMQALENPFHVIHHEVTRLRALTPNILVDIHAEATSEKIAIARFLDGQVSAVIGTHTHVQTADEQIFPGGTAFLCDAGFTGPQESVLGRQIGPVIKRFMTCLPQRFPVAEGMIELQGVIVEIDNETGKATKIERVRKRLP